MTNMHYIDPWHFAAGLGLFLFGLTQLEDGISEVSGKSFKKFLRARTRNPLESVLSGTVATALLQSSSVVTLMVLAFVGAGVIQLQNALGIIFGSNLGTTLTGWIVATLGFRVDVEAAAFPIAGIGALIYFFAAKKPKIRSFAKTIVGFGLLFLGLGAMKSSVDQLAQVMNWGAFAHYPVFVFLLVSFAFTAIIQSSSATMVITLSALNANLIELPAAAAVVIGADLGTTITVMLGAINGSAVKKQVAAAHFGFNLVTDTIAFLLLSPLLYFVQNILGFNDPLFTLVAFHSSFNILGIVLFLPAIKIFTTFLQEKFPDSHGESKNLV